MNVRYLYLLIFTVYYEVTTHEYVKYNKYVYLPPVTSQYNVISESSLNGSETFDLSLFLSSNITGKRGGSVQKRYT